MKREKKRRNTNRKKRFKIITNAFLLIMIIISIVLIGSTIYLDVLPNKYLIIATIVIGIIDIISIIIALLKKIPKKLKIINMVINIILSIIMLVIIFLLLQTKFFLKDMNINYKTLNYSVIVLKNSDYEEIDDLKNKKMGYLNNNSEGIKESLDKIDKTIEVQKVDYKDLNEIKDALLLKDVDSILLEESYYNMLTDIEYSDVDEESDEEESDQNIDNNDDETTEFGDETKVIYSFSIKVKTNEITKNVDNITKDAFNIYISGLDTFGKVSSVSRTDVNMIVTVNPKTHQILLTSIPRDYYVQLHGTTGLKDKLTHSGIYGIDMSVQTMEDLFGIDINYYFKVNFTSVVKIVDKLDGVDVYSEYNFTSQDRYHYTKGYNHVNGLQALSFVRERKNLPGGDRQRIKDQQAMIEAIFRRATNPSIIIKYSSLLNSLKDTFITNMTSNEITNLIKMQIDEKAKWTITTNSLEGIDSRNRTYSIPSQSLYVMVPKEESVENATNLINSVINDKKLEASFDGDSSDVHAVSSVKGSSTSSKKKSTTSTKKTTKKATTNKNSTNEKNKSTDNSKKADSSSGEDKDASGNGDGAGKVETPPIDTGDVDVDEEDKDTSGNGGVTGGDGDVTGENKNNTDITDKTE